MRINDYKVPVNKIAIFESALVQLRRGKEGILPRGGNNSEREREIYTQGTQTNVSIYSS